MNRVADFFIGIATTNNSRFSHAISLLSSARKLLSHGQEHEIVHQILTTVPNKGQENQYHSLVAAEAPTVFITQGYV